MSFNSNPGEQSFIATAGQTEYDFNFKIFNDSDILVYQTPSGQTPNDINDILILTTDYTVIITGDAGGKVTLVTGAGVGDTLVLRRNLPQTRDTEYQTSGDLLATTLNDDQDYQTYLILDSTLISESAIRLPDSAVGVNTKLPGVVPQYFLRWNTAGDAIENAQAVVQEITQFDQTNFRVFTGNKNIALSASLIAAATTRTFSMPNKDGTVALLDDIPTLTGALLEDETAQTKIGDLTIGQELTIDSWSFVTTTITINTAVAHNLSVGQDIRINGLVSTTNTPQGIYTVASIVDTDTITFTVANAPTGTPTVSSATLNSGDIVAQGKYIGKNACTAWARIDGTTTPPTIDSSFRVSGITRLFGGVYDLDLVDFDSDDYSAVVTTIKDSSTGSDIMQRQGGVGFPTTTTLRVVTGFANQSAISTEDLRFSIHIFGGKN